MFLPQAKIYHPEQNKLLFDVSVKGGGGLYFGFKEGTSLHLFINYIYKTLKFIPFKTIHSNKSFGKIIGLGLGFGPYKKSSPNFIYHMETAKKFDFLSVRDPKSYHTVKPFNSNVLLHTDLAFNPVIKDLFVITKNKTSGYIGIIFRDWLYGNNAMEKLIWLKSEIENNLNKKAVFISFNPENDRKGIRFLETQNIPVLKYNPFEFDSFMQELSKMEWIISQRAHGMIIAHLLNIPSIGIEIEPKIRNVHNMIPRSSKIVTLNNIDKIPKLLSQIPANKDFSEDRNKNILRIEELLADLNAWKQLTFG